MESRTQLKTVKNTLNIFAVYSMYRAGYKLEKENENHGLNHDLFILLHTQSKCVCHSVRSMFRVLGVYNFG